MYATHPARGRNTKSNTRIQRTHRAAVKRTAKSGTSNRTATVVRETTKTSTLLTAASSPLISCRTRNDRRFRSTAIAGSSKRTADCQSSLFLHAGSAQTAIAWDNVASLKGGYFESSRRTSDGETL